MESAEPADAAGAARSATPASARRIPAAEVLLTQSASNCSCNSGARAWLRGKFVRDKDLEKYGLRLDDDWECADETKPVVISVHGFNSTPQQNAAIMVPIRDAGYRNPASTFDHRSGSDWYGA